MDLYEWRSNGFEIIIISEQDRDPLPVLRYIRCRRMSPTEKASRKIGSLGELRPGAGPDGQ